MVLEFDSQCATAQPEDSLQLYVPALYSDFSSAPGNTEGGVTAGSSGGQQQGAEATRVVTMTNSYIENDHNTSSLWPVLRKFYGTTEWPKSAVLLPGIFVVVFNS